MTRSAGPSSWSPIGAAEIPVRAVNARSASVASASGIGKNRLAKPPSGRSARPGLRQPQAAELGQRARAGPENSMPRTAASTAGRFSHAITAASRLRPGHQPARSRAARTSGGNRVAAARCAVYWAAITLGGQRSPRGQFAGLLVDDGGGPPGTAGRRRIGRRAAPPATRCNRCRTRPTPISPPDRGVRAPSAPRGSSNHGLPPAGVRSVWLPGRKASVLSVDPSSFQRSAGLTGGGTVSWQCAPAAFVGAPHPRRRRRARPRRPRSPGRSKVRCAPERGRGSAGALIMADGRSPPTPACANRSAAIRWSACSPRRTPHSPGPAAPRAAASASRSPCCRPACTTSTSMDRGRPPR